MHLNQIWLASPLRYFSHRQLLCKHEGHRYRVDGSSLTDVDWFLGNVRILTLQPPGCTTGAAFGDAGACCRGDGADQSTYGPRRLTLSVLKERWVVCRANLPALWSKLRKASTSVRTWSNFCRALAGMAAIRQGNSGFSSTALLIYVAA